MELDHAGLLWARPMTHLAAGAAVLGNTSAPIGGDNTNCVIAGHRGWRGADYFRHIDRLAGGRQRYADELMGNADLYRC